MVEVALALRPLDLPAQVVELLLQLADPVEPGLLPLPAGGQCGQLLLPVGQVTAQPLQPLLRGLVGLVRERQLLHLQPVDRPLQLVDLDRPGVDLHPQPGRGLVDQVDRLVRQEPGGDVAVGQRRGGDQRGVGDLHLVVRLVPTLETAQDRDRVLDRRLADQDLLEPALQGGVLLDPLAVFVQRGRADHPQLAAGQHRLEHVAGVHRALGGAGPDDRVQLVDECDDLAVGLLDLVEDGLEPLLELAAVLGAGDHRAEVERDQPLVPQRLRHVAGHDPLGQALDDRGLADAGLADQHGVVLGPPGQHLDHPADLGVPADDRVELAVAGGRGEVDAVLLQRLVRALGVRRGHPGRAADLLERAEQRVRGGAVPAQQRGHRAALGGQADQQVLGRHVFVGQLLGLLDRGGHHLVQVAAELRRGHGGPARARQPALHGVVLGPHVGEVGTHRAQQRARCPVGLLQQGAEQVRRLDGRVAPVDRVPDGCRERLLAPGGELVGFHLLRSVVVLYGVNEPRVEPVPLNSWLANFLTAGGWASRPPARSTARGPSPARSAAPRPDPPAARPAARAR